MPILAVNLLLSTLIFWIAVRLYLLPRLNATRPQAVLLPILLLHSFRHLGLMFLEPGATYAGIPPQFAYPAAYGDLLAAVLALISIRAVAVGHRSSRLLVWAFNVEGSLDLLTAITLATVYQASAYMGPAYWIASFWVPALLVTHYITFLVLLRHWPRAQQDIKRRAT
jgi:nitric oxide reductase large subunit